MQPSFDATPEESALIDKIVKRAADSHESIGTPFDGQDGLTLTMDLTATNANGTPINFQKLLDFPDFDFWHDVFGIAKHIDRETGQLTDFFLPRSAKSQDEIENDNRMEAAQVRAAERAQEFQRQAEQEARRKAEADRKAKIEADKERIRSSDGFGCF